MSDRVHGKTILLKKKLKTLNTSYLVHNLTYFCFVYNQSKILQTKFTQTERISQETRQERVHQNQIDEDFHTRVQTRKVSLYY